MSSLADVAREAATRYGDTPLYVTHSGEAFSYAALDRLSDAVAAGLYERGVRSGDVVGLLLPSAPAYAVVYVAAVKIGAITAGVNDRLSAHERALCLALAGPRLVVAPSSSSGDAVPACGVAGTGLREPAAVVEIDTEAGCEESLRVLAGTTAPPPVAPDPERPVAIVFTSGTTGEPKGALFAGRQLDAISDADGRRAWGAGGRALAPTSFAHVGYMTKLPQALRSGGTTYLMKRWSAPEALELAGRHRVTTLGGIPTMMALMLRQESFASTDLSSVRMVVLGGGPSTAALIREIRERVGVPVVVRYTCTEAGVGTGTDPDGPPEDAEETVGRARLGVELTVRDESDHRLGPGEVGHVCLRSPAVMSGYWRNEAATAAALTADGAVRTGDMGFVDETGRLHLTGRSKEMYVRGGYNVYPLEVENALADHPLVAQVAIAPRPDPVMGEVGVAVVVPRDPSRVPTLESLRDHARLKVASYKLPDDVVVLAELPRTAMEKIDRRALGEAVEVRSR